MVIEKCIIRLLESGSDKYAHLKQVPEGGEVLDIGCGDCRRLRYRNYFRDDLINHGIDVHEDERCSGYLSSFNNLDVADEPLPFPGEYFDLVVVSHVVEHMPKGGFLFCLKEIIRVLKKGGCVYVEFPSEKTRHFHAAQTLKRFGCPVTTLNFYDDESHVSLYTARELAEILKGEEMSVIGYGDVREPIKRYLSPFLLVSGYVLRNECIFTGALWSLVGWASFVIARK